MERKATTRPAPDGRLVRDPYPNNTIPSDRMDPVALKITGGRAPLTIMVNGVPLAAQNSRGTLFFQPDGAGFVRLTVMDARGAADSVTVRLQ